MNNDNFIHVKQFCISHEIEISLVESFQEYGLVEILIFEEESYIQKERLTDLEKLIRLHQDLQINMEGLDVITELLRKVEVLQQENGRLRNKLNFYEK